jgi:hypothetical protein
MIDDCRLTTELNRQLNIGNRHLNIGNRKSAINLPIAAATATATTTTTATSAAGLPAARAPATSTTSGAASSAPSEVGARWTRFVDGQPAALQGLPIKARDGPLQVLALS